MNTPSTLGSKTTGARGRIYGAAMRLFAERGGDALTISELAEAAGIARGTIYNNIRKPENLFGEMTNALAAEMIQRTEAAMEDVHDLVARIATGLRLFVRRSHEEKDWGRFLVRFGLVHSALQNLMAGPPARDIGNAIAQKRFKTDAASVPELVTLLNGATMAAMHTVIEVASFDNLMCGHDHLKKAGRKSAWGVGRHVLGSQIFDYWKNPWGHELEHWTDGDQFAVADGSRKATLHDLLNVQWGPLHPMARQQ